jgi:hypothetical protein
MIAADRWQRYSGRRIFQHQQKSESESVSIAPACVRVQYDNSPYNTGKCRGVKRGVSLCWTPREYKAFTIGLASMRERFVASDNDALRVYDRLAAALDKNSLRPQDRLSLSFSPYSAGFLSFSLSSDRLECLV